MSRSIAVLTSGGDAPGMNAAVRAVTRTALARGWTVHGVHDGFRGLIEGRYEVLTSRSVAGILQCAGTVLGSSRAPEFVRPEVREGAIAKLVAAGIDGLVVIGGNGSQTGTRALSDHGYPVVGVASTIDNDLAGTEATLGTDSALHVALEAIDRLKVTSASHQRASIVEVMGRHCGYLALMAGVAGGAEAIVIPEAEITREEVARAIKAAYERGKSHALVVVAEGARSNAHVLAEYLGGQQREIGFDLRVTVLGHVQRGGAPSPFDRLLGTRLGAAAVDALAGGRERVLVGWQRGDVTETPLDAVVGQTKALPEALLALGEVLAQ